VEQEGTYPLPEAQVDRFMMKVFVNYPYGKKSWRSCANFQTCNRIRCEYRANERDIFAIRNEVNQVKISESLEKYIIELVDGYAQAQRIN